jgi:uncharacterized protein (DUF2252 family)
MPRNAVDLIRAFNAGRDPERLALKYRAMAADPFAFLRGSCHLFYQDYVSTDLAQAAPAAWICGDLHLENFGSYLGDNRLAYFDLNDFGEALLAPATWELSRFLVSVQVAANSLSLTPDEAIQLSHIFLATYASTLAEGKIGWVDHESGKGMVGDLLREVRQRDRARYLHDRTQSKYGFRTLRLDGKRALPVDQTDRDKVRHLLSGHAETQSDPKFFDVLDIARRIAGTGSLGIERYVLLVHGDDPEHPALLDLRHEPGSALAPYVPLAQPQWPSEAARVVGIQRRMQANCPACLSALSLGERSYVLRELLPNQDRLALSKWNGKFGRLEKVMHTMGEVLAWAQLRASKLDGADAPSDLHEFADALPGLTPRLLDHAETYTRQVVQDWHAFRDAQPADQG